MRLALVLAFVGACVKPNVVECDDGRVCPDDRVCADEHDLCVTQDQLDPCTGVEDGTPCEWTRAGKCDRGLCVPACGDAIADAGEECDDGDNVDHDGCSADCRLERAIWRPWQNTWTERSGHAAVYDSQGTRVVLFGGAEPAGATASLWVREDETGVWTHVETAGPAPSARVGAMMAYDPVRNAIVLFGGGTGGGGPFLGDTWVLEGTTWRQIPTTPSPSPRLRGGMAFDEVRGKVVLFGGYDGGELSAARAGYQNDTWEFDGAAWTQVTTTGTPAPRMWHAFVWHPTRDRLVMFGGIAPVATTSTVVSDTWELVGTTWTCTAGQGGGCPNVTRPSGRYAVSMAYSRGRDAIVMFGGHIVTASDVLAGADLWEYRSTGWTALNPNVTPIGRYAATLTDVPTPTQAEPLHSTLLLVAGATDGGSIDDVWQLPSTAIATAGFSTGLTPGTSPERGDAMVLYDPIRERTLRISGYLTPLTRNDVFTFDGRVWQSDNVAAPNRYHGAATFDTTRSRIVQFGGLSNSAVRHGTTWVSSGATWSLLPTTGAPSPRHGAAMAHDGATQVTVLFGGNDAGAVDQGDTWELDDSTWTLQSGAGGPGPQQDAAMGYDSKRAALILVDVQGRTWRYVDHIWQQLDTGTSGPPARKGARMVFFSQRERLVLYGGVVNTGASSEIRGDLWELEERDGVWTWQQIEYSGTPPPPRSDPGISAHASLDALVLHGGTTVGGDRLNDTWILQYTADGD